MSAYSIVIPTIGRPSLRALIATLDAAQGPLPERIVIVDDRASGDQPVEYGEHAFEIAKRAIVLRSYGAGPAGARNTGWRATNTPWVCFVDDDVLVTSSWRSDLASDIDGAAPSDGGISARVNVPLPADRPPTDWERNVASLAHSAWITADMVYRRNALDAVGGFDERFPRAYREDADLALRVQRAGYVLRTGERRATHPVRPADPWVSVRLQRGNADDAMMRALHGPNWREDAQCPPGRFPRHVATVAAAALSIAGALTWAAMTAEFAWRRIEPGPKDPREIATMTTTSAVIPFAAVYHRLRGEARARALKARAS
jgi:hypothetical protein